MVVVGDFEVAILARAEAWFLSEDVKMESALGRKETICLILCGLAALGTFAICAAWGPVNLDDPAAIENNPLINQLHFSSIFEAISYVGPLNLWHPVTWWSHQGDTLLFGFPSWGARHAVNVVIYSGTAGLLYLFLRCLTGSSTGSLFATLLFAVHPQRVEVVAWVTARKELLVGAWILVSCLCWWYWRQSGAKWLWWAAMVAFLAALGSHPVAVVFPAVLVALDLCIERPLRPARRAGWPGWEHVPFLLAAVAVAVGTLWIHRSGGLSGLEAAHGEGDRIGRILLGAWHYASTCFWPVQQRLFAIPPSDAETMRMMAIGGGLVLVVLFFGVRHWIAEEKWVAVFGVAWMAFFLLPVSGIVAMSPYLGADRYTYLPQMGLAVLIACFWPARFPAGALATALAVIAIIALFVQTERRIQDWKDSEALFRAEVVASPRSKLAALHLGAALLDANRPAEALVWFEKSLSIDPKFDLALHNAALARVRIAEQSSER